jgi:predicted transporter
MAEASREPRSADSAIGPWLGFWLQLLILGLLALVGAGFAGLGRRPGDYAAGMVLILASVALAFLRLQHRLDGGDAVRSSFLFVSNMKNLTLAIPLLAILGFIGLVIARLWPHGSLHIAGIALFVVSAVIGFLDIKQVFDQADAGGR